MYWKGSSIKEDPYRNLLIALNRDKQIMKDLQKQVSAQNPNLATLSSRLASAEQEFQMKKSQFLSKNPKSSQQLQSTLKTLQFEQEKASYEQLKGLQYIDHLKKSLKCKKQELQKIKSEYELNVENLETVFNVNEIEFKILEMKKQIETLTGVISGKVKERDSRMISDEQIKLEEQLEDLISIEGKLKDKTQMKRVEEQLEKNKLVVEYGKLSSLQIEKEEKQQTLRSLIQHSEQIEERVMTMKKQKKNLKRRVSNGYPVRDQILTTQKQNELLEQDLVRARAKLNDEQKLKTMLKSQSQFSQLKNRLNEVKDKQMRFRALAIENKRLTEELQVVESEIREYLSEKQQLHQEKKKKLKSCQDRIVEAKKQKEKYEISIKQSQKILMKFTEKFPDHYNRNVNVSVSVNVSANANLNANKRKKVKQDQEIAKQQVPRNSNIKLKQVECSLQIKSQIKSQINSQQKNSAFLMQMVLIGLVAVFMALMFMR